MHKPPGGVLLARPYIRLLKENNVRTGFFEHAAFEAVTRHLPLHFRGIAAFAYITGWWTPGEILPLEWRQVDMQAGEVRLDPGTTKNGEGRVFPFTSSLWCVLDTQQALTRVLIKNGEIHTRYVFCYLKGNKAGRLIPPSAGQTPGLQALGVSRNAITRDSRLSHIAVDDTFWSTRR